MMFIIFAILSVLPNGIYCIETNNFTVLTDNITEEAVLSNTVVLKCPMLTDSNIGVIIWYFDNITIPVPMNPQEPSDVNTRIRGGKNGSLIISNVNYDDSKIYKCMAYETIVVFQVDILLVVLGPPLNFNSFTFKALPDFKLKFSWTINVTTRNPVFKYNITLCKSVITNECQKESLLHPRYNYISQVLPPFSDYHASIIAFNKFGRNARVDVRAKTGPGVPIARTYILTMTVHSRNVTMKIECMACDAENMKGALTYFNVIYHGKGSLHELKWPTNTTTFQSTISDLHPYTNYSFNVSASNGVHSGPEDFVSITTLQDYPKPTKYLWTSDPTSHEIMVNWDPASDDNGPITGYTMQISDNNEVSQTRLKNFSRSDRQYNIRGLKPNNPYTIKLSSTNSVGQSDIAVTIARTDRDVPKSPKIRNVKIVRDVVQVSWRHFLPPENEVIRYVICWITYIASSNLHKCVTIYPNDDKVYKCSCPFNNSEHSVYIPSKLIGINVSRILFSVKLGIRSTFCYIEPCRYLEAESDKFTFDYDGGHLVNPVNDPGLLIKYPMIISLTIGCVILLGGFIVFFCFCTENRNFKYMFALRQSSAHYTRSRGEYIEVFPKQITQLTILPFEKNPYTPVIVNDLVAHITNYRSDGCAGFQAEFEAIESMDTSRWSATSAISGENKIKNRYTNILSYDHSRVALQYPCNGKSNYINANFVDGYNRQNAFIATQGPLADTVADFWQMVYEQNSEIIVMISNFFERGRCKCEMYWVPNKAACYGNIVVSQIYQKQMAFYTERRFSIKSIRNRKNAQKERTVYHYQYTDWRDFDVPPSSLPVLVFVKATIKHWSKDSGPIIAHCSAGVGRTGTYICIESQIRQMETEHRINVRGFLEHIRQQRMKLVQTESQYTFIHDALYEYYLCPDHEIHKDMVPSYIFQLKESVTREITKLEEQFLICTHFEPTHYELVECNKPYNISKNRSNILPIESRRINLSCEPGIEGSNYINASALQGYWQMKEFIITQHPLEETEADFWKMVWDENCTTVILLSSEKLHQFWPVNENDSRSYRCSRVNYSSFEENENISHHKFLLSSPREDYALDCAMHRLKRWPDNVAHTADLLRLLFKVNAEKDHTPVVVVDDYGGSSAGIFVALSSLLNQLRCDDVVDVYFVMKMIHLERPHTFSSTDDLTFVYKLVDLIVANWNAYPFFALPNTDGMCNRTAVSLKRSLNNSSFVNQCATLNSSVSRRHAPSTEAGALDAQSDFPVKYRAQPNRISWNPIHTRNSTVMDGVNDSHHSSSTRPHTVQIFSNPVRHVPSTMLLSQSTLSRNSEEPCLSSDAVDTMLSSDV